MTTIVKEEESTSGTLSIFGSEGVDSGVGTLVSGSVGVSSAGSVAGGWAGVSLSGVKVVHGEGPQEKELSTISRIMARRVHFFSIVGSPSSRVPY